jgi:hypothetical protein
MVRSLAVLAVPAACAEIFLQSPTPSPSPAPPFPAGAWFKAGECKIGDGEPTKKDTPWIQGEWADDGKSCHSFAWSSLETAPDQWDFSAFDKAVQKIVDRGFQVETSLGTGYFAPHWLYDSKHINPPVEIIKIKGKLCGSDAEREWPNYLNKKYQERFVNAHRKLAEHVASMPYAKSVAVLEVKFGTSGDRGPWHGDATSNKELAAKVKKNFDKEYVDKVTPQICETYKAAGMRPRWNDGPGGETTQLAICPDSAIKIGQLGQGMETNFETDYINADSACMRQGVHCESEFNECRYVFELFDNLGMYLLVQHWITSGLSNPGLKGPQLCDKQLGPYWDLLNVWALANRLPVDDATTPGGILFFRDGLDANDKKRFPTKEYGTSEAERVSAVVKAFAKRGAIVEDSKAAVEHDRMKSRARNKANDVGLGIYSDNYGNGQLTQLCPDSSSTSWWRPQVISAPKDMPYGRWSRSFGESPRMGFDVSSDLWGGKPQGRKLLFRVIYLDKGHDTWELHYAAAGGCNKLLSVKKSGTGKWREATALATDAAFDGSCPAPSGCDGNTDVSLVKADGDSVFHSLEVARAEDVPGCLNFPGVACDSPVPTPPAPTPPVPTPPAPSPPSPTPTPSPSPSKFKQDTGSSKKHYKEVENVADANSCCDLCADEKKCGHWVFEPENGKCELKEGNPTWRKSTGHIGGESGDCASEETLV